MKIYTVLEDPTEPFPGLAYAPFTIKLSEVVEGEATKKRLLPGTRLKSEETPELQIVIQKEVSFEVYSAKYMTKDIHSYFPPERLMKEQRFVVTSWPYSGDIGQW